MNLQLAFTDARLTFPNFPEEIFALWFDDRIRHNGWPPNGPEWAGFLCGRDVTTWQQVVWAKESVLIDPVALSTSAFECVKLIIEAALGGQDNVMARYIPDTKQRFSSSLSFIQKNGVPPGIVLLLAGVDGYDIIDGNHRIAALLANWGQARLVQSPTLKAWIASLPCNLKNK